jgi:hypothetical protein
MTFRSKSIAVRLIYPLLTLGLFAFLPIAIARENKCTSGDTAFMIAKRFTTEQMVLVKEDEPDFPWMESSMTHYLSGCTHEVQSWFDRKAGEGRERVSYTARVHYDVFNNHWDIETWQMDARAPIGGRS